MKRFYLAFDMKDTDGVYVGFYSGKYASTHFSAVAKSMNRNPKDFVIMEQNKTVSKEDMDKALKALYKENFTLLNKNRRKVDTYVYYNLFDNDTVELRLIREIFCDKMLLKDLDCKKQ